MDLWSGRRRKIAVVDGGDTDEPPYLPEDIIFLILTRLPVKHVLRCRSVCKLWKALIANPSFTRHHQSFSPRRNPTTFLAAFPVYFPRSFTLVWIVVDRDAKTLRVDREAYDRNAVREFAWAPEIVGDACCGVFCLAYWRNTALWNPATRELRVVEFEFPGVVSLDSNGQIFGYVGFGAVKDEMSNVMDFKILYIVKDNKEIGQNGQFLVYSLRVNSSSLVESPNFQCRWKNAGLVWLNGVLHWLAKREGAETVFILTFNLVTDAFGQIELPPHTNGIDIYDRNRNFLTVFDNQYLSFGIVDRGAECLNLWVMREIDGERLWVMHEKFGPLMKTGLMLRYSDCIGGVITQADLDGRFWYHDAGNSRKYETRLYGITSWFGYSESLVSVKSIANRQQNSLKKKK